MVVIASNNPKLARRWSRTLQKKYPLHIVNQKLSLRRSIGSIKPLVLLLDADLPRLRAGRELPNIQSLSPSTKILLLSAFPTPREGINALSAGAKGYANQKISAAHVQKAVACLILRKGACAGSDQGNFLIGQHKMA